MVQLCSVAPAARKKITMGIRARAKAIMSRRGRLTAAAALLSAAALTGLTVVPAAKAGSQPGQ
jgi:hypothetical protein